ALPAKLRRAQRLRDRRFHPPAERLVQPDGHGRRAGLLLGGQHRESLPQATGAARMKADVQHLGLVALIAAAAIAGCNRNEKAAAPTPAPAASTAAAPASAPAPAGPIIAPVQAQEPTDAQRTTGATIAAQGGGGAVAACNSCHGAQGEGNAAGGFPRIAGQTYSYLAHALESYASGSRK